MLCLVVGEAQLFQPLVEIGQVSTVAGHLQATAVASAGNSMVECGLHVARMAWRDFMPYKNSASQIQTDLLTGYCVVKALFGQVS